MGGKHEGGKRSAIWGGGGGTRDLAWVELLWLSEKQKRVESEQVSNSSSRCVQTNSFQRIFQDFTSSLFFEMHHIEQNYNPVKITIE